MVQRDAAAANGAPAMAAGPSLPAAPSGISLGALAGMLWTHRYLISALAIAAGLLAFLVSNSMQPRFQAQGTLVIETQRLALPEISGVVQEGPVDQSFVRGELQALTSRPLILPVAQALKLDQMPEFNPTLEPPTWIETNIGPYYMMLPAEWRIWLRQNRVRLPGAPRGTPTPEQVETIVTGEVTGSLDVLNDGRSYVITVGFLSENPKLSADFVNTLMQRYISERVESRASANRDANSVVNERITDMRGEIADLEKRLNDTRTRYSLFETRFGSLSEQQLAEVNTQLTLAKVERAQAESRYQRALDLQRGRGSAADLGDVQTNASIQNLRQREAQLRADLANLSSRLGPNHPDRRQAAAALGEVQGAIGTEIRRVVESLGSQLEISRARERVLETQLTDLRENQGELARVDADLRQLTSEITQRQGLLATLLGRSEQTNTSPNTPRQAGVRVIAEATPPLAPATPKTRLALAFGFVAGGALGAFIALLLSSRDRGYLSSEDLAADLGLPVLASMGRLPGRGLAASPARHVATDPHNTTAETLRGLRAALRSLGRGSVPKVVMFTSALPNEGKSSIAAGFARIAAADGLRTLLIDTDLRRPSIDRLLGVRVETGLANALEQQLSWRDCVAVDETSGCHLLLAEDDEIENPRQMLESMRFQNLLAEVQEAYNLVVLDTPPVMLVSDAVVLAYHCDAVVMVVEAELTRRGTVREALERLALGGRAIAGTVLSKARRSQTGQGYYSGSYSSS